MTWRVETQPCSTRGTNVCNCAPVAPVARCARSHARAKKYRVDIRPRSAARAVAAQPQAGRKLEQSSPGEALWCLGAAWWGGVCGWLRAGLLRRADTWYEATGDAERRRPAETA